MNRYLILKKFASLLPKPILRPQNTRKKLYVVIGNKVSDVFTSVAFELGVYFIFALSRYLELIASAVVAGNIDAIILQAALRGLLLSRS